MKKIRGIFFDAGGTLFYAYPSVGEIYSEVTAMFGARVEPQRIFKQYRDAFYKAIKRWNELPSSDLTDKQMWREITSDVYSRIPEMEVVDFDRWFEYLYKVFAQPQTWRLFPDVTPVLWELKNRGLTLAIVSNWDTRLRKIVEGLGLFDVIEHIVISAEVGVRKPKKAIFEFALNLCKLNAVEAMHVGDLYVEDVKGAIEAGLEAVYINRKGRFPKKTNFYKIKSMFDLLNII
jgi:putative hydrolase of the HAD superfamily